jgi:TonB family protein
MKTNRFSFLCATTLALFSFAASSSAANAERSSLRIQQTTEARFPSGLLLVPITKGEAWVMITVDADGTLTDALATRYTHEAFAREAVRVLHAWKYEPARMDGNPIAVLVELHFTFESSGAIVSMDATSTLQSLTAFAQKPDYVNVICAPTELDRPPTAIKTVSPVLPERSLASRSKNDTTVLDFIIDEKGTPRMPVLVSTPDQEYANRAADALGQWQFTPPTRRGRPVAVRVQQAFIFPNDS